LKLFDRSGLRGSRSSFRNGGTPVLDESGEVLFVVEILLDVTESFQREAMLRASIREKEVLLREVHHRVKNNLQIVSSLLNLQCGSIEDEAVRDMLLKSHDRIRAMAGAHEALYAGGDLAYIDAAVYLGGLANSLRQCYGNGRADLKLDLKSVPLTLDQAVPIGIIVNELLTNAFKHAFPGEEGGEVVLTFSCTEPRCALEVRDNGRGDAGGPGQDEAGSRRETGLGLKLIDALVSQLGGRVSRSGVGGYSTVIVFPLARQVS
jgi:two-component sensor histidine kinase